MQADIPGTHTKSASRKDSISEQGLNDPNVSKTSTEQVRRPEHRRSMVGRTSTTQPWKPWKWRCTQRPRCGRPYCADRITILPSTIVPDAARSVAWVGTGPLQSASNFSRRQYSPSSAHAYLHLHNYYTCLTTSFPVQTWKSRYQKGKNSLDLNEARDYGV